MLGVEQIENNKQAFISILNELKDGTNNIDGLIQFLEINGFFHAPASTKYHCSYDGGLCQHSLDVYRWFNILVTEFYNKINTENIIPRKTIIVLGLLHDIYKTNYYEKYFRNVKDDTTGEWSKVADFRVKEGKDRFTFGDNAFNTYLLISTFIGLNEDEIVALNNQYCGMDDNYANKDLSTILSKYPLTVLLHCADMICTYLFEGNSNEQAD